MGEAKRRKLAGEPPRDHGGPYTCPNCGHAATFLRNDAKRYGCPKCGVTTVAGAAVELHERGTDTIVFLQVGKAGELTPEALKKSVTSYAKALRKLGPLPPVELAMLGYDDDPREIFEIPEARRFYLDWMALMEDQEGIGWDRFTDNVKELIRVCYFAETQPHGDVELVGTPKSMAENIIRYQTRFN